MSINILLLLFLIFISEMSVNFLLQATKIIHIGTYTDAEVGLMYDYLKNLDNLTLNNYFISNNVLHYKNDLELCVEIFDKIIKILESKEDYEKCQILLTKKKEALNIMKNKID